MKNLKLALIAVVIAFTTISIVNADGFTKKPPVKKIVNITLKQAIQNPDLVIAMYHQLDPSFLMVNQPSYSKEVLFHNNIVRITGSYNEWTLFFRARPNWE